MNDFDQVPNPVEDLKHAHALLERMSPEELLKATYALEEIIEASPWFQEKMRKLAEEASTGPWFTTEEVVAELGFRKEDFPNLMRPSKSRNEAA